MDSGLESSASPVTPRTLRNVINKSKSGQLKLTDFSCVDYVPNLKKMVDNTISNGCDSPKSTRRTPQSSGKKRQKVDPGRSSGQKRSCQTVIDANQRDIGARQCKKCGLFGDFDDEKDRREHEKEHRRLESGKMQGDGVLKYTNFPNETLLSDTPSPHRIILVRITSGTRLVNKARSVVRYVSLSMDAVLVERLENAHDMVLLLVSVPRKVIVGCLCADVVSLPVASPSADASNAEFREKAVCGVDLMWTDPQHRRQGLATLMLQCLWRYFARSHLGGDFGKKSHLAFSEPTDEGRRVIESFIGGQDFLLHTPRSRRPLD